MTLHNSPEIADLRNKLMLYFLEHNYYCADLKPYLSQLIDIVEFNHQINDIFKKIIDYSDFNRSLHLNFEQFADEKKVMDHFFEYVYFSQQLFLKKQ